MLLHVGCPRGNQASTKRFCAVHHSTICVNSSGTSNLVLLNVRTVFFKDLILHTSTDKEVARCKVGCHYRGSNYFAGFQLDCTAFDIIHWKQMIFWLAEDCF